MKKSTYNRIVKAFTALTGALATAEQENPQAIKSILRSMPATRAGVQRNLEGLSGWWTKNATICLAAGAAPPGTRKGTSRRTATPRAATAGAPAS